MFSARGRAGEAGKAQQPAGAAAAGGGGWMSSVFSRVRKVGDAISPRVVQPSDPSAGRSWASSSGVIRTSELTHFERISLNAMEERVLPPDVRIKIVCAQANAVEQEEEQQLEEDVKRLDGLVRTLALYGVLERNAIDVISKSDKLAPERERELGKMLVAAVQLELFQMLDDICETGDMENELFDDLCTDTIQEGRRAGFIFLTAELLLSPGSGYKRLLQIRKDQFVEEIADVAGLRAFGGHDCQRDLSESPKPGSRQQVAGADSDICSPGSAAGGPGLKIARSARSVSANLSGLSPSPSSQRPDSRSPSPENGHRRTQTQRVRDLLSSIDGLVMESEQPEEALGRLPPLSPSNDPSENGGGAAPRGRSVRGYKRQSTGAMDPRSGRSSRLSLRTPPAPGSALGGEEEEGERSPSQRAFFPNERDWRGSPFGATPPPELAGRRASVIPDPGAEDGDEAASADMLLAEVDWLIAGTNAALGQTEGGSTTDGKDSLESTPDESEPPSARDGDGEGDGVGGGKDIELVDPIGNGGLEVTPDKRELSPRRDHDNESPETAGATRVAEGQEDEGVISLFGSPGDSEGKHKRVGQGGGRGCGAGDGEESADSQQGAGAPSLPSPEASLTASPSPETRGSSSSPIAASDAESVGDDGGGAAAAQEDSSEAGALAVSLSSGTSLVQAGPVSSAEGARGKVVEEDGGDGSAKYAAGTVVDIRVEKSASAVAAAGEENFEEGTGAAKDDVEKLVQDTSEEGVMEGNDTLTQLEPAVADDASVHVTILEDVVSTVESGEGQQQQQEQQEQQQEEEEEEEDAEHPAFDAVAESGVTGSDPPAGTGNGGAVSLPCPNEERAELKGGTIGLEGDGDRDLPPAGAVGRLGESPNGSTALLKPEAETGASPEAGEAAAVPEAASASGGDMPPVVVEPDASHEVALPEWAAEVASSGDGVRATVSHGEIGDPEDDVGGSRGEAVVVVEGGAGVVEQEAGDSAFEDIEL
eukprot:g7807.t1